MSGTFTNGRQAAAQVSVLVADAQPLYRDAVARAVRQDVDLRLLAEAADGRDALSQIRRLRPDVAVIDLELPELEGRRVIDAVVRDRLPSRVVVLSAALGPEATFGALGAGAAGYLSKSVTSEELRRAIRAAAAGDSRLDAPVQTVVAREIRLRHRDERPLLSERELDVLRLIADGLSHEEIGARLGIGAETVRTHMKKACNRRGATTRTQAVAVALRLGLIA